MYHSNNNKYPFNGRAQWSFTEEKLFEQALIQFNTDDPFRWQNVAGLIGKTVEEVENHYYELLQNNIFNIESGSNILDIESGLIPYGVNEVMMNTEYGISPFPVVHSDDVPATFPFPLYGGANEVMMNTESGITPLSVVYSDDVPATQINQVETFPTPPLKVNNNRGSNKNKETKHWTVEEQQSLLVGLRQCGKGDWRGISRNYVKTRTPTQVASHAQKYFKRLDKKYKPGRKKRSSIHDTPPPDILALVPVTAPVSVIAPVPVPVTAPAHVPVTAPIPVIAPAPVSITVSVPVIAPASVPVIDPVPSPDPALLPFPSQNLLRVSSPDMVSIPTTIPNVEAPTENEWFTIDELLENC